MAGARKLAIEEATCETASSKRFAPNHKPEVALEKHKNYMFYYDVPQFLSLLELPRGKDTSSISRLFVGINCI